MSFEIRRSPWLNAHPAQYDVLFDDGQIREPLNAAIANPEAALTVVYRAWDVSADRIFQEVTGPQIEQGVDSLLEACWHRQVPDAPGSFADTSRTPRPALDALKVATAATIKLWDLGCKRQGRRSPFEEMVVEDFQSGDEANPATPLILATAEAIRAVSPPNIPVPGRWPIPRYAARGILAFGPRFTTDFLAGTATNLLTPRAGLAAATISPSLRRELLATSARSLLQKLETFGARIGE